MKRLLFVFFALCVILCGCGSEYSPDLILTGGLYRVGDTICGSYVNEYFFYPYRDITAPNGDIMTLYSDDTYGEYFSGDALELRDGENRFVLIVSDGRSDIRLDVVIDCTLILDFTAEITSPREYSVHEAFDRSSVTVTAQRENGEYFIVRDYDIEYDFSAAGVCRVRIEYGGICHDVYVTVTE